MSRWYGAWSLCVLISLWPFHTASGVINLTGTDEYAGSGRPMLRATRIADNEAPSIDGDLSDPVWANAVSSDEFYQVFPEEGATPSERTVVSFLYDEKTLYIAVHAYDRSPDEIVANILTRDGELKNGDFIGIFIDSYNSGRNAFGFAINPLGARREGLIENNSTFMEKWNTIWRGKAKIVESGWTAEIAIPFQSISYTEDAESWGLQIVRKIARRNEQIRWSSINQSFRPIDMTEVGRLYGVVGASNGLGLDIEALGTLRWIRNWENPGREDDFRLIPSGNIYYKVTPSLTATATINTDFSSAPLDQRQVNTGRFSLFFPETRDFFLQDASVFEFGGRSLNIDDGDVNGMPFFSRRIGFVEGEPISLTAGAKLSGSLAGVNVGALTTRMAGGDNIDPQILSVMRASKRVFGDTQVGVIATYGDPAGHSDNAVLGADIQFQDSTIFNGNRLILDAFFLSSLSDRPEQRGNMFGAELAYPSDSFFSKLRFRQIDDTYQPALGFLNRPGIRSYLNETGYRYRMDHEFFQFLEAGTWHNVTTDLGDEIESRQNGIWFGGENNSGDMAFFDFSNNFELIRESFSLPNDVLVPAGRYEWNTGRIEAETSNSRAISFRMEAICCDFFNGSRRFISLTADLRPSPYFNLNATHKIDDIELPTGEVTIHVSELIMDINLTPDLQFKSQIQYDSISKGFGYLGRIFWEVRPETEIFLSLSNLAVTNIRDYRTIQSGATIQVGNTFRY